MACGNKFFGGLGFSLCFCVSRGDLVIGFVQLFSRVDSTVSFEKVILWDKPELFLVFHLKLQAYVEPVKHW